MLSTEKMQELWQAVTTAHQVRGVQTVFGNNCAAFFDSFLRKSLCASSSVLVGLAVLQNMVTKAEHNHGLDTFNASEQEILLRLMRSYVALYCICELA